MRRLYVLLASVVIATLLIAVASSAGLLRRRRLIRLWRGVRRVIIRRLRKRLALFTLPLVHPATELCTAQALRRPLISAAVARCRRRFRAQDPYVSRQQPTAYRAPG
jgi:hypothetical protein